MFEGRDVKLGSLIKANILCILFFICLYPVAAYAQQKPLTSVIPWSTTDSAKQRNRIADSVYVRQQYKKLEVMIPMRDGVKLFTSIYIPKDTARTYPIMLNRTPYNVEPYGPDKYLRRLGPSRLFTRAQFIFAYQDVRGRYMSEGVFVAVRPYMKKTVSIHDTDESTDAYDTIDWLIRNIPDNNGRVGVWGISAEGFYATCAAIDAHPALKAVSPQAPVTNWFMGDDRHHNGVFQEQGSFTYLSSFGAPRKSPTTVTAPQFSNYSSTDIFGFYLKMGPLKNFDSKIFHKTNQIWNDLMAHGNYDRFWQSRTPEPHLKNVSPAMLVVGGFFDQEDLYGALHTHKAIEQGGHQQKNILVMGPWVHGGFSRFDGDSIAGIKFGQKTGAYYREKVEFPFFMHYLKDGPDPQLPNALVFESGKDQWKEYDAWPAVATVRTTLYFQPDQKLSFKIPKGNKVKFSQFVSDPANPVPYTSKVVADRGSDFMVEDQRFTINRPDVLIYRTEPLNADIVFAGSLTADLFISTTGTDADFVVKIIDVYPDSTAAQDSAMSGYQMLIRGEIMRAKFRNSFTNPEPLIPGKITEVKWVLPDINHCFRKGHRIMIQVQSTWFPLNDRNPQTYTDIYKAGDQAFKKANHRVWFTHVYPSHIDVSVLSHLMNR